MAGESEIHGLFSEWEREETARREQSERLKELFKTAKGNGWNPKALRVAFAEHYALAHFPAAKLQKREADLGDADLYLAALSTPLAGVHTRETPDHDADGVFADDEEINSNAPAAASYSAPTVVEEITEPQPAPSAARDLTVPQALTGQVATHTLETANELPPASRGYVGADDLREPAATAQGQIIREGDAPRETDRYENGDDRLTGEGASCPDTDFPIVVGDDLPTDEPGANASKGVTGGESAATNITQLRQSKPLRPNCLNRDKCGGQGRQHCYSCEKAAAQNGAA